MSELGDSLRRAGLTARPEAIERTADLAAKAVAHPQTRRRGSPARLRWALALGVVALLVAATPAGRSAVSSAAELVGIGGPPTKGIPGAVVGAEAVVGLGETPNGTAYEVVAGARPGSNETCLRLDLLDVDQRSSLHCLTADARRSLAQDKIRPLAELGSPALGTDRLMVHGTASREADRVEVIHELEAGEEVSYPVEVFHLEASVVDEIGAPRPVNYLVAFLPDFLVPPDDGSTRDPGAIWHELRDHPAAKALHRISVIAYDSAGGEIARTRLDEPFVAPIWLYSLLRDEG